MKTQNIIYEIPKDLEEKPYAHEPTIGFSAPVSKKPQNLYNQRSTIGFLAEGRREDEPRKIEVYQRIPNGRALEDMLNTRIYKSIIMPEIIPYKEFIK